MYSNMYIIQCDLQLQGNLQPCQQYLTFYNMHSLCYNFADVDVYQASITQWVSVKRLLSDKRVESFRSHTPGFLFESLLSPQGHGI